jgi:hypothetical protein
MPENETALLEFKIEPEIGTLGSILQQRRWELSAKTKEISSGRAGPQLAICQALGEVTSLFFLSHSWKDKSIGEVMKDRSTGKDSRRSVMHGLARAVEGLSLELVWTDEHEMEKEDQFSHSMAVGVGNAWCVLILVSMAYLASPNCLKELAWAFEGHATQGKRVIVVSVDEKVTYKSISSEWKADKDIIGKDEQGNAFVVGRRTVAFARKWLTQVKIFEEWTDGHWDPANAKKRTALQNIFENIGKGLLEKSQVAQAKPDFQVREEAGVWFVQDMSEP